MQVDSRNTPSSSNRGSGRLDSRPAASYSLRMAQGSPGKPGRAAGEGAHGPHRTDPDSRPHVTFRLRLGGSVRTQSSGREGRIVGGRLDRPMPTARVALAYAVSYRIHPERGPDFEALEVDLEQPAAVMATDLQRRQTMLQIMLAAGVYGKDYIGYAEQGQGTRL